MRKIEQIETLIIGGGQAGLAMSDMLSRRGLRHCILERNQIAQRWRSERWDGLRFQFPNWSVRLPNFPFKSADPDGFATSEEIVDYLMSYAACIRAPIRCGVSVNALDHCVDLSRFVVATSEGSIEATNVVVATGPYQRPIMPDLRLGNTDVIQVHASAYKEPRRLPAGAVLVVGSGASGAQIAEELQRAGRRVYLSVSRHRRMPRRYRGRDLTWWLSELGLDQTPTERRGPDKTLPLITGAYGGHTIDFRDFAQRGITLLGRVVGARDGTLELASDLGASLAHGDAAYAGFLDRVDAHVDRYGLQVSAEPAARAMRPDPPCVVEPIRRLDLEEAHIRSVIWATGYTYDLGWINLPVVNGRGEPRHSRGITEVPGLYFLGLQWLSKMNSSFLAGVGDDAARLAQHILTQRSRVVDVAGKAYEVIE
jgi:putative flavoprotein involved in K+ transport